MWRDPLLVFYGVLESLWVRLLLFAASIFLGGFVGAAVAGAIPTMIVGGTSIFAALGASMVSLIVFILAESTRIACAALALNCIAWSWLVAITANAIGHA